MAYLFDSSKSELVTSLNSVFVLSIDEVLITMMNFSPINIHVSNFVPNEIIINSIVKFKSSNVVGCVSIYIPEELAYVFIDKLLHVPRKDAKGNFKLLKDGIGEVANMIAGCFKNKLIENNVCDCLLCLPEINVIKSENISNDNSNLKRIYLRILDCDFVADFKLE